jgi:NADPH:quinone reductase-like Zn-dependent oxidoreductase
VLLSGGGVPGGGGLVGPLALIVKGRIARLRRRRVVDFGAPPSRQHLEDLLGFVAAGTVSPVVERTYPLADVPDALRQLEQEHARAKIVITM